MQTVKHFIYGHDSRTGESNTMPLEDQFNEFLKKHPDHRIASMSTIVASSYKEAFVVFNIRGENQKPHNNNNNKKQERT